ncbi:MAG TPA: hypothetical protein VGC54_06690 [Planctomycetota bacterium]
MKDPYTLPDLGDAGTRHEVNVFVFRRGSQGVRYLLVQSAPRIESFWRPLVRTVGLDEDLFVASLNAVRFETGLDRSFDLRTPAVGVVRDLGDLRLIDWPVGMELHDPDVRVRSSGRLAAAWRSFDEALRTLGDPTHRQNLLQVHWSVAAA